MVQAAEEAHDIFNSADKNGDGELSKGELKKYLKEHKGVLVFLAGAPILLPFCSSLVECPANPWLEYMY